MNMQDDLKKVLLAGIGALALTAEKSKEVVDVYKRQIVFSAPYSTYDAMLHSNGVYPPLWKQTCLPLT